MPSPILLTSRPISFFTPSPILFTSSVISLFTPSPILFTSRLISLFTPSPISLFTSSPISLLPILFTSWPIPLLLTPRLIFFTRRLIPLLFMPWWYPYSGLQNVCICYSILSAITSDYFIVMRNLTNFDLILTCLFRLRPNFFLLWLLIDLTFFNSSWLLFGTVSRLAEVFSFSQSENDFINLLIHFIIYLKIW